MFKQIMASMALFWTIFKVIHASLSMGCIRFMNARLPPHLMDMSAMQTASSNLPVIGQVANGVDYLQSQLGSAIKDFKNIYSEFEDAFCTPAQYTPPTKVPANLTGARKQASLLLPGYSPSYVTADSTLVHPR